MPDTTNRPGRPPDTGPYSYGVVGTGLSGVERGFGAVCPGADLSGCPGRKREKCHDQL